MRCARSPASWRGCAAASIEGNLTTEGATWAPSSSGAGRRRRGRRRRGRRGRLVVELFLGAEQRVEDLVANALAERDRGHTADDRHEDELPQAAAAALALLRARAQRVARRAQRAGRVGKLLLELLVIQQLRRRLAVVDAAVCDTRGVIRRLEVPPQVLVLDESLHVGAGR